MLVILAVAGRALCAESSGGAMFAAEEAFGSVPFSGVMATVGGAISGKFMGGPVSEI